jgi:two-component system, OmpR family, phosphate regulon sensor histidine kinase PhoR
MTNFASKSMPPTWQAMLDGLLDAAMVLDRDCRIIAANGEARATFGAQSSRHIALVNRSPDLLAALNSALTKSTAQRFELRVMVPVDRLFAGQVTPLPCAVDDHEGPALLLVLRDQTEQEQLSRLRADFVANASHELRTPLASLKGFVETLQGAARDDSAARARFLPIMQAQADRMSRLIEDLLSLSRIEMREHVPPRDRVDLIGIAMEALNASKQIAETANVTIAASLPSGPVHVTGDREELLQVVHNLLQNAIKYGRSGGTVDISVRDQGPNVVLDVTDDGIGIAAWHLPRLTERFYRVSAKDSRDRGGTGLGLAIVKHIINRHNGELKIASKLGEGSTFSAILRRAV